MASSIQYPSFDCQADECTLEEIGRTTPKLFYCRHYQSWLATKSLSLDFWRRQSNETAESQQGKQFGPRAKHFGKLVKVIKDYFNLQQTAEYQRFLFRQLRQTTDNKGNLYNEWRQLAPTCNFTNEETKIKSRLITSCKSSKSDKRDSMTLKCTSRTYYYMLGGLHS